MMPQNQPDLDTLISLLDSDEPSLRQQAAIALSRMKDARVIQPLLTALSDEDGTVRANAATGLGENQAAAAIEPLIELLRNDEQDIVRERAAVALAQIGNERAIDPLIEALDDRAVWVRNRVIYLLGTSRHPRAVDPLLEQLKHKDPVIRSNAAWALGAIADERALEPLLALLDAKNDDLRGNAAWALGQLGDERAVEPLFPVLDDPIPAVRGKAIWSLGKLVELTGDERIVPQLLPKLNDFDIVGDGKGSHVFVCEYVAEIIPSLGSEEAFKALQEWQPIASEKLRPYQIGRLINLLGLPNKETVDGAIGQLVRIGPQAVHQLTIALQQGPPPIRQGAARALGQIGHPDAGPKLMMALADPDAGVWSQAVAALTTIGKPVVPLLQQVLNSKNKRVRYGAAMALWRIQREDEAFQIVLMALQDDELLVRSGALIALIQQPDERALATLQIRLNEEDEVMARYVLQALNALGSHGAMATIAHWMSHHNQG
ncbi:MAG: HEAT repeat domain-containing protein [Anaerolineae bacterium]|nr:HEAT repeat domain-containing protein [Anaerolineae bacterium]